MCPQSGAYYGAYWWILEGCSSPQSTISWQLLGSGAPHVPSVVPFWWFYQREWIWPKSHGTGVNGCLDKGQGEWVLHRSQIKRVLATVCHISITKLRWKFGLVAQHRCNLLDFTLPLHFLTVCLLTNILLPPCRAAQLSHMVKGILFRTPNP